MPLQRRGPRNVPHRFTEEELSSIRAAWAEDPHPERVAAKVAMSSYLVRKAVKLCVLPKRAPSSNTGVSDRQREVLALYESLGTLERAAQALGTSTSAVQQTVKRIHRRLHKRYGLSYVFDDGSYVVQGANLKIAVEELRADGFTPRMIALALGIRDGAIKNLGRLS